MLERIDINMIYWNKIVMLIIYISFFNSEGIDHSPDEDDLAVSEPIQYNFQ